MGKKREAGQKETPGGKKQRQDTIRCNTDPQSTTRRKRREKEGDEQENQQKNERDKEPKYPEMAIILGRRAKRNREKQKKIAKQEKKTKKGKRNTKKRQKTGRIRYWKKNSHKYGEWAQNIKYSKSKPRFIQRTHDTARHNK